MKKNKLQYNLVFTFILLLLGIVIVLQRIQFGITYTDETWYVAEPYITSKGAIPYVDTWTQAPGFVIPLFLLSKAFSWMQTTEGVMLFFRVAYVFWLLILIVLTYSCCDESLRKHLPLSAFAPFLLFAPKNMYYISYNTIGIWYLLLAGIILLCESNKQEGMLRREIIRGLIGGLLIARAIIGTPNVFSPCVVIAILLILHMRFARLAGYVLGGGVVASAVVLYCGAKGGFLNLINGLGYMINDLAYFGLLRTSESRKEMWVYVKEFVSPCLICLLLLSMFWILTAKRYRILYERAEMGILLMFLGIGVVYGCINGNIEKYISYTWFIGIFASVFLFRRIKGKGHIIVLAESSLLFVALFLFSAITNVFGANGREHFLFVPSIFSFFIVYLLLEERKANAIVYYCFICFAMLVVIRYSYQHIYRDAPIEELNTKITSGIWKGCYTTEEREKEVIFIENVIKEMTEEDDKVLFMDWASFAYLMTEGQAFTPSTLDNMLYSYHVNNPALMYHYFRLKEDIPDKIIYVDYGRDEHVSIEDGDWAFNSFVESNYAFSQREESGKIRVLLYERTSQEDFVIPSEDVY